MADQEPLADCGHESGLRQHCAKCKRWCCPTCYSPWMALVCSDCRTGSTPTTGIVRVASPEILVTPARAHRCRTTAPAARKGALSYLDHEIVLEERIADLERRLDDISSS